MATVATIGRFPLTPALTQIASHMLDLVLWAGHSNEDMCTGEFSISPLAPTDHYLQWWESTTMICSQSKMDPNGFLTALCDFPAYTSRRRWCRFSQPLGSGGLSCCEHSCSQAPSTTCIKYLDSLWNLARWSHGNDNYSNCCGRPEPNPTEHK